MPQSETTTTIQFLPHEIEAAVRAYFKLKEGTELKFDVSGGSYPHQPVFQGITATRKSQEPTS